MSTPPPANEDVDTGAICTPIICFSAILLMNTRYMKLYKPRSKVMDGCVPVPRRPYTKDEVVFFNYRSFFEGIRAQWVKENFVKGQVPVQTIRDYVTASSAFGGAALLFVSILVGLSRTGFFVEPCVGGPACKPAAMLGFIKFASVIINFILVFFNFLLALRYSLNVSFLMSTPMLDGMPLPPSIASSVLSRAHFHYTLGLRGIFLSLPLVAWMFGYPMLLGMTVIYLLLLFVWEDESLTPDIVWEDEDREAAMSYMSSVSEDAAGTPGVVATAPRGINRLWTR